MLKKHQQTLNRLVGQWGEVANSATPLHVRYDNELREARVSIRCLLKQLEDEK